MKKMEVFAGWILFLTVLGLSNEVETGTPKKEIYMKGIFGVDVTISGHIHTVTNVLLPSCSMACLTTPGCKSLGYQAATATCWLYDHLVEYTTNGSAAPGTQYLWMLSPRCPTELGFSLEEGFCYLYVNERVQWNDAHAQCKALGSTLFIADTPAKLTFLRGKIAAWAWIGASDLDEEGSWRWFDGGALPWGPAFWNSGQPDNASGKQNVVVIETNGKLNDDYITGATNHVACQIHMV